MVIIGLFKMKTLLMVILSLHILSSVNSPFAEPVADPGVVIRVLQIIGPESQENEEGFEDEERLDEVLLTDTPTVEAITTEAKTTEAKTTEAKTTEAKTTEAKTTEAKTTEAKTTEAKTTEASTTVEAITTEAKTTEAKTTEASTTALPGPPAGCVELIEGSRICYAAVLTSPDLNWADARTYCQDQLDGDLASLDTLQKREAMFNYLAGEPDLKTPYFWLGGSTSSSVWTWTNGIPVTGAWVGVNDQYPSEYDGSTCMYTSIQGEGLAPDSMLVDAPCTFEMSILYPLCEKKF